MMKNGSTNRKGAFTLVEMLVVVTLIAIVATIAISLLSGARKDSAEVVNISNIKHLTNLVGAYEQINDGRLPNKLDSLIDRDKVATATYTVVSEATQFQAAIEVVDNPGTVLYVGLDADKDGVTENPTGTSLGLMKDAWTGVFSSLTVSKLTTNDVAQLNKVGLFSVQDLYTGSGELFNGMERYEERVLQAGDPVVIVDPQMSRNGRGTYKDLGFHDIMDTSKYALQPGQNSPGLTDEARGKAMAAKRYLVFGIGPNCTMIGNSKVGLTDAPVCKILPKGHYKHYLLVVKVGNPPTDVSTVFAGILDPQGNTARSADSYATRTAN